MIANEMKNNNGKVLATILALVLVCVAVTVIISDSVEATETDVEANTDLSAAINVASDGDTLILQGDVTLSGDILKPVTIKSADGQQYTITITKNGMTDVRAADINFENVTFAFEATGDRQYPSMQITSWIGTTDVSFTGVQFDDSYDGGSVYAIGVPGTNVNVSFIGCDMTNGAVVYDKMNGDVSVTFDDDCTNIDVVLESSNGTTYDVSMGSTGNAQTDIDFNGADVNTIQLNNGNMVIPEDESVTANKIVKPEYGQGDAKVDGELTTTAPLPDNVETTGDGTINGQRIIPPELEGKTGIDQNIIALSDPVVIEGEAYLAGNVTIPAGRTLTITNTGSLLMNNFNLTVEGTLIIEGRGSISGSSGQETITLMRNATIQSEGTIGSEVSVKVVAGSATTGNGAYAGVGDVTLLNVTGVNFSLVRDSTANTSTLAISGDFSKSRGTTNEDDKIITFGNGAIINGAVTATRDVTISGEVTVVRGGSIITSGTLAADVTLENGSSVQVNGLFTGTILAQVQDAIAADSDATINAVTVIDGSSNTTTSATGFGIEVKRTQYSDESGDVYFDQRAYLTGNITSTENRTSVTLTFEAPVFVESGVTITASSDVTLATGADGLFVVSGTIQNVDQSVNYVGAYYEITADGTIDPVQYISGFDVAIDMIADVDGQTITLSGTEDYGIEITANATVANDQVVDVKAGAEKFITIAETATITVEDGGEFTGSMIGDINGKLVVMDGGYCTPYDDVYDVKSTDDDDNITYAGLNIILSEAQPGDVITVTGPNATVTNITVPNGVTLEIEGTLTVSRSVTVAQGGELVVKENGTLNIGTDSAEGVRAVPGTLTVAGEADVTEGTLDMRGGADGTESSINSTGTFVYRPNQNIGDHYSINGAYYLNIDGNNVLTTVANAVAGAVEADVTSIYVNGTVNDTADVSLGGITLYINPNADATLGTIDVEGSVINMLGGELTATITGIYGDEGSTADATINLVDAYVTSISNSSRISAQNVNVWYMNLGEVKDGTITIAQGTVTATGNIADTTDDEAEDTFIVASGATMSIGSATTVQVSGYKEFTVDGMLSVVGEIEFLGTVETVTIAGTMTVDGTVDSINMDVTGTITVTDNENTIGSFTATGAVTVGDEDGAVGTLEGDFTLSGNGAYVFAYPGSTISSDSFGSNAKVTEFYVNGELYATAYTANANTVLAIGTTVASSNRTTGFMNSVEITGFVTEDYIGVVGNWYSDSAMETPLVGTSFNIGGEDAVYIELAPDYAPIRVSIGSQIALYVDGLRVSADTFLSVGTHTVEAVINPGYTGNVTITFNGETVSNGGTITVTPEMTDVMDLESAVVLSVTGQLAQDSTVVIDGGNGGSDMGLTDYLLIILVVLIVIMAIMVAMRLMRS